MPAILDHLFYGNSLENRARSSNLLTTVDGVEKRGTYENDSNSTSTSTSTDSTEGIDYSGFHFLGALLPDDVACAVADGIMDPVTMVFIALSDAGFI